MRIELSALFGMDYSENMVSDTHVGDGVFLQEFITNGTRDQLFEQVKEKDDDNYRNLLYREELEVSGRPYTHRFYVSLDGLPSQHSDELQHARQSIMRAIVLSRIVKPLPIPLHPTTVLTIDGDSQAEINIGFYSTAYVVRRLINESITEADATLMSSFWAASQHLYDNRKHYKRLHRALMAFNDAYHILPSHISHVVLHAALETLICTSSTNNKKQFVHRLPQLIDEISQDQATEIYRFCADVKHEAAPGLLYSTSVAELDPRDQKRYEAAAWLEGALRTLFIKALEDRSFAEEMEDKKLLGTKYPVPK